MRILGIVDDSHDSGLAILENGVPDVILEEERHNRDKHSRQFPAHSLDIAFTQRGLDIADIDVITTPWHVPSMMRTYLGAVARRLPQSLALIRQASHPTQNSDILFQRWLLPMRLRRQLGVRRLPPLVGVRHHDSHAASFFVSPFDEAAILVMDGYGDDASTSAYVGRGNRVERQWNTSLFNSLGMIYTLVTAYLGFKPLADEGKVMGLAAFGTDTYLDRFRDVIRPTDDGRYVINMDYFSFDTHGLIKPMKPRFYETFGPALKAGEPLSDRQRDIAYALQKRVEEVILSMVRHFARTHPTRNLVLTGGVALNCVANARVLEETDYENVWVPPCASDTGAPFGSALWHYHQTLGHPRGFEMTHAYYGTEYDDRAIVTALADAGLESRYIEERELIPAVADDLAAGKIVAWFQGRYEIGPRALGNRSILADPRRAEMKDIINARVKHREAFRPFAPAVLEEHCSEYFEIDRPDPFMTIAPRVRADKVDIIPAAVHVDGTGRIQTVSRAASPRYYDVIKAFG
ncbi:MAG: carbamoyltransferase, partial [Hyphomicrobiaceae bacterium]